MFVKVPMTEYDAFKTLFRKDEEQIILISKLKSKNELIEEIKKLLNNVEVPLDLIKLMVYIDLSKRPIIKEYRYVVHNHAVDIIYNNKIIQSYVIAFTRYESNSFARLKKSCIIKKLIHENQ